MLPLILLFEIICRSKISSSLKSKITKSEEFQLKRTSRIIRRNDEKTLKTFKQLTSYTHIYEQQELVKKHYLHPNYHLSRHHHNFLHYRNKNEYNRYLLLDNHHLTVLPSNTIKL